MITLLFLIFACLDWFKITFGILEILWGTVFLGALESISFGFGYCIGRKQK